MVGLGLLQLRTKVGCNLNVRRSDSLYAAASPVQRGAFAQRLGPDVPKRELRLQHVSWRAPRSTDSCCRVAQQIETVIAADGVVSVSEGPTSRYMHQLSNGLRLEVLHQRAADVSSGATSQSRRPPLLFVHGAAHGAWCWQEHFMPYFAEHGYECFAVSMRAHGGSDATSEEGSMIDQLSDLSSLIASLPEPPILVAHSLGGIVAQRYLIMVSNGEDLPGVAAVALLTNAGLRKFMPSATWFTEQPSMLHAARVFWWMIKKPFHERSIVKDMLFSSDLPASDFERYHQHFRTATTVLPIKAADMSNYEPVLGHHPLPPVWVMGAGNDAMIMPHQIHDAADFFGTEAVLVPGVAHDVMLDTRWRRAADVLDGWFATL